MARCCSPSSVAFCVWLILALVGCATMDKTLGADQAADLERRASTYPEPIQEGYRLFRKRCDSCHDLGEPLSVRLKKGAWKKVVKMMARRPGSGIPPCDVAPIAAYLEHHFAAVRKGP